MKSKLRTCAIAAHVRVLPSNRTSLELKRLNLCEAPVNICQLSNRTSLELKSLSSWLVVAQFIAPLTLLIRTSLELKRAHVPLLPHMCHCCTCAIAAHVPLLHMCHCCTCALHMCAYLLLIAPVRKVKCHSTQRERRLTFSTYCKR